MYTFKFYSTFKFYFVNPCSAFSGCSVQWRLTCMVLPCWNWSLADIIIVNSVSCFVLAHQERSPSPVRTAAEPLQTAPTCELTSRHTQTLRSTSAAAAPRHSLESRCWSSIKRLAAASCPNNITQGEMYSKKYYIMPSQNFWESHWLLVSFFLLC